jgi:hypothetical protein
VDSDGEATLQVFNALGQSLAAEKVAVINGEMTKALSFSKEEPSGIYFVRVTLNDQACYGWVIYEKP